MAIFEDKKSSNDIINNDTMGNNEIVASYMSEIEPRWRSRSPIGDKYKPISL